MTSKAHAIGETRGDRIFRGVTLVVMTLFFLAVLYPILYVIGASFSSPSAIVSGQVTLLPVNPTLDGYRRLITYRDVWVGYRNSAIYTAAFVLLSVALTVLAAYPLSRKDFRPRNVIMFFFAFTMWFSGGMIPNYLLVRDLGLINSPLALILPGAMGVYNMIITRTYFQTTLPDELLESAKIDGCSDFSFLLRVALPLSPAILAVVAIYCGVGMWNSYMGAFLYLNNRALYPLQIFLREVLVMSQVTSMQTEAGMLAANDAQIQELRYMAELLKFSLIIVSSLPLVMIYPLAQRYFMKGLMIGAIKG